MHPLHIHNFHHNMEQKHDLVVFLYFNSVYDHNMEQKHDLVVFLYFNSVYVFHNEYTNVEVTYTVAIAAIKPKTS